MNDYQYFKQCKECGDGKQIGQLAVCPIHHSAIFTLHLTIPITLPKVFVDPAMA